MLKLGVLKRTLKFPPVPKRSVTEPLVLELEAEEVDCTATGAGATMGRGAGARGAGAGREEENLEPEELDRAEDTV